MSQGIEHLSKYITPQTSGIIWLTDNYLDFKSPGVYEFNYLLDGILIKSINYHKEQTQAQRKSHFFLGENFGTPLFIGHSVISKKDDIKQMYHHFDVAKPFINKDATIYIFNRSQNTAKINILKELQTKYKNYTFENLNI